VRHSPRPSAGGIFSYYQPLQMIYRHKLLYPEFLEDEMEQMQSKDLTWTLRRLVQVGLPQL
jgi:hypothetical protein